MKQRVILAAVLCLGAHASSARAELRSAGVRENFVTPVAYHYGSDRMARVKYYVFEQGFGSITATIPLLMKSAESSQVFFPQFRTKRVDLETLIARVAHGKGELVLKPILTADNGLGIANRLTGVHPADPALFFATYHQALRQYVAIASTRDVHELVAGVGLHALWKPEFAAHWLELLRDIRRQLAPGVRLSIELSSERDLEAWEAWKSNGSATFASVSELLDRIRVAASPVEASVDGGGKTWSSESTRSALESRLTRAATLFPAQKLTVANVTIPACGARSVDEDEVRCLNATRAKDFEHQQEGLEVFYSAFDSLREELRAKVVEIEFREATTEFDALAGLEDARCLFWNDEATEFFKRRAEKFPVPSAPAPWTGAPGTVTSPAVGAPGPQPATLGESWRGARNRLACVYFERRDAQDRVGPIQSKMLVTLLGAFRSWRVEARDLGVYRAGDLFACESAFYIASAFFSEPSREFLADAAVYAESRPLAWMNYKLPLFQAARDEFAAQKGSAPLGFTIPRIDQPLVPPSASVTDPGFYRFFDYKGETFMKLARWDPVGDAFSASPELNVIELNGRAPVGVVATVRHSKLPSELPYAVHQRFGGGGGLWYFADLPLSYVHYEDRYFILCDQLWDILGETPPPSPRTALVRLEDINQGQDPGSIRWAIDYLADRKIPFSMAVIPYYSNLFGDGGGAKAVWRPANEYPEFSGTLLYAKARGANMVFHGVAHQAGDLIAGFDGQSAADYEFWSYPANGPLPKDSSDYLIGELEKGEAVWRSLGLRPLAWEVPHYAASGLDFTLFGRLFEWTYHRALYFDGGVTQDVTFQPRHRFFECLSAECREERRELARKLRVETDHSAFGGQIVPFVVYNDVYGQAVIPETLGMIDYPFFSDRTWIPVSHPRDVLRFARKLRVVRGAVASFFWHVDLLSPTLPYYQMNPGNYETEGGRNTLITVVQGLKELGYEFGSIGDCRLFPRSDCLR